MVNGARGERTITIGSRTLTLVPEFQRFAAIETATGKGVMELLDRANYSLSGVVQIIACAARESIDKEELAALLLESGGTTSVAKEVDLYLCTAVFGLRKVNEWLDAMGKHPEGTASAVDSKSDDDLDAALGRLA